MKTFFCQGGNLFCFLAISDIFNLDSNDRFLLLRGRKVLYAFYLLEK